MNIDNLILNWINNTQLTLNSHFLSNENSSETSITNALFLGEDTSDKNATGEDIFSKPKNLPTAVASLLNAAQKKADFHPSTQTQEVCAEKFDDYLLEVDQIPFLYLNEIIEDGGKFYNKDYDVIIDSVLKLYGDVTAEDEVKITESITEMANSVFSVKKAERYKSLFSQPLIDYKGNDKADFSIVYTSLFMKHDKDGKSELSEQSFIVKKINYNVLSSLIHTYAKDLAKLTDTTVSEWINNLDTPYDHNSFENFGKYLLKAKTKV